MSKISPCFFGVTEQLGVYQVSYEITNLCNLKCKHCCNDSSSGANKGLSKDEIFDLVDELKEINVTSIYLTGGEPTMMPYFNEIVEYINLQGINLVMATNGFNISSNISSIKKNISHQAGVFVSLDGVGMIHDEFRGIEGAFDKTVNSIKMLVSNKIPTRISTVVWKKNIMQLEEIIKLAKSLGVYQINFSMLFSTGRAVKNNIEIESNQYKQVVKEIHLLIKKYSNDKFIVSIRRDSIIDSESDYCRGGEKILHINSKGKIFPCSWSEKCSLGVDYGVQWKKGNMKECVVKLKEFQNLVRERISLLGHSGCLAMAIDYYKDKYADDPINELLK